MALNEYTDTDDITNKVTNIVFRGEKTNIIGGLDGIKTALKEANGNRLGVRDVVVVVTDGEKHNTDFGALTDATLTELKNGGTEVFAVVHSSFIGTDESAYTDWEKAVTDSDHLFVFDDNADSYSVAQQIKMKMDDSCLANAVAVGTLAVVDTSE